MKLITLIKNWIKENKGTITFIDDLYAGYEYLDKFQDTKEYKREVEKIARCTNEGCKQRFFTSTAEQGNEIEIIQEHYLDPVSKRIETYNATYSNSYIICPYCKKKVYCGTRLIKRQQVEEEKKET